MSKTVNTALARKLSAGQDDLSDRPRSIPRALRLGFARAAGDGLNLPLAVIGVRQTERAQNDLFGAIDESSLLLVFRGSQGMAAACLDVSFVSAIVQSQTIGEILPSLPEARVFTDTDAAMVAPLIEDAFARAAGLVETQLDQASLSGYEFLSRAEDLRALLLTLVDDRYHLFDLTVDLAGGLRQGQISVLLPDCFLPTDETEDAQKEDGPNLEQSSGVMRAELNAVLCRLSLPLSGLSSLNVGDQLPLDWARLDRTEILTIDRSRAAVGRLGQCGGLRAVRLNEHMPLPTLADPEAQRFVESPVREPDPAQTDPLSDALDITIYDGEELPGDMDESDPILTEAGSERMVAEISQLAGLKGLDDESGPSSQG